MTQPSDNWFWGVVLSFFGLIFVGGVYDFIISGDKGYEDLAVYSDMPLSDEIDFPFEKRVEPQLSSSDLNIKDGLGKEQRPLITGALTHKPLDEINEIFVSTQLSYMSAQDIKQRLLSRAVQNNLKLIPGMAVTNKIQYMSYLERNAWLKRFEVGPEHDPEYTHSITSSRVLLVSPKMKPVSEGEGDASLKQFSENANQLLGARECGQIIRSMLSDGPLRFSSGLSTVKKTSILKIRKIADQLKKCSFEKLVIEGHTDNLGRANLNQRLSEKRAAQIRLLLMANGIEPSKIDSVGFGASQPLRPNDTLEHRALNRRISIKLQ